MKIEINDNLIITALEMSQSTLSAQEIVHQVILTYIQTQAGHHLVKLGGKAPDMKDIRRRNPS
jgi:hypothetical protein